jgi:hypothetical protein
MLAKQSSGSANGFASWYDTPGHGERGDINSTQERGPFWSSVVDFFVEGLAACGTSLHPVMFFMEQPVSLDLERGTVPRTPAGYGVTFAYDSSSKREREIRKAVAALERLDDRTLHGLGIRHRSHIEQTVRYCHDC